MSLDDFYDEEIEESFSNDPDDFYDIMRDDSGCELWSDLGKLKNFYVDKPTGYLVYFKNDPKRFWESVLSTAQHELDELSKVVK